VKAPAREPPEHLGARAHRADQEGHRGKQHPHQHTACETGGEEEGGEEGHQTDDAVGALDAPCADQGIEVDQPEHRRHHDRGEHGLREVIEVEGEKKDRDHHRERAHHRVEAGLRPGPGRHRGARERAADHVGVEDAADDVGEALTDQLLVGVELLALLDG
jgi:hypothetical protein